MQPVIDAPRLLKRIAELGGIGRDKEGRLTRLACSTSEKLGRDLFVRWAKEAGLTVEIDRIGNIFAIWENAENAGLDLVLTGSHIDTVINAGIYDGCYGVLAGLEVIEAIKAAGFAPQRPIAVAAFTNEEGVRYAPDMMGSLVFAGGLDVEEALASTGIDGSVLRDEIRRIGYAGDKLPGFLKPHAYVELHIEQGPVLERDGVPIGAVENLQGISWQRITVEGVANHAGTTPMSMRQDAGVAAAKVIAYLNEQGNSDGAHHLATVGSLTLEPNAINVIPSKAVFTVDMRDPDEVRLKAAEEALAGFVNQLAKSGNVTISVERLARFEPVIFDKRIVRLIEAAAAQRGLDSKRMTSGAGHDAQMIARIAPSAMIFVPSVGGISHNPREHTDPADLIAGAGILLDVVMKLASADGLAP